MAEDVADIKNDSFASTKNQNNQYVIEKGDKSEPNSGHLAIEEKSPDIDDQSMSFNDQVDKERQKLMSGSLLDFPDDSITKSHLKKSQSYMTGGVKGLNSVGNVMVSKLVKKARRTKLSKN